MLGAGKNSLVFKIVNLLRINYIYRVFAKWWFGLDELGMYSYVPLSMSFKRMGRIELGDYVIIGRNVKFESLVGGVIKIGNHVKIDDGVILTTGANGRIVVSDYCSINPYVIISGHGGVTLNHSCRVASHVVIVSFNHGINPLKGLVRQQELVLGEIYLGHNIWIGSGARILQGVTIASNCVVAAGAVVNKSFLQEYNVIAGVPAIPVSNLIESIN